MNATGVKDNFFAGLKGLRHLLWPAVCINCGKSIVETDNNFCKDCWEQLLASTGGDYCPQCGRQASKFALVNGRCPDCIGREMHFDGIARCGVYEGTLRAMIVAFKMKDRTELDRMLGFLGNSALEGAAFYKEIEVFVPVPLHWSRRLIRGYNHSFILAKKLGHHKAKVNTDLARVRQTETQFKMETAAARAANVKGAFAVRAGHNFKGRNICLVDDIKTTGATLNECAKVLKEAGAAKVYSLVWAVAGQHTK